MGVWEDHMNRKLTLAVGAGVAAFGAVVASAATLGGVTGGSLGADTATVASCDSDGVTVGYTTSYTSGSYKVTGVTLSGVNLTCVGKTASITLSSSGGGALGSASGAVVTGAVTGQTFTLDTPAAADQVAKVSVLIAD